MGRKVGGRWEGVSRGRGHMYTYDWFMLMSGRNQHNIVKQLSSRKINKNFFKKNFYSGDTDLGKTEECSREEKQSGTYKGKSHKVYVTAEITYSPAHARHQVLSLDAGYCWYISSTWKSRGGCLKYICMHFTMKALTAAALGYIRATSWLCYVRSCDDSIMATLWLCCGWCYGSCASPERGCVMATMPDRRE